MLKDQDRTASGVATLCRIVRRQNPRSGAASSAHWSELPDGLMCTYFSPAHKAVAAQLRDWMRVGRPASGDRRRRQCRRPLCERRRRRQDADRRFALRHGGQCRPIRRASRNSDRAGRRRTSASRRPATAVPSRCDRLCRGGGRAVLRALSRQRRDRRLLRRDALAAARRQWRQLGDGAARGRASIWPPSGGWRVGRRRCAAISKSISSKGRCCCNAICRSGS